MSKFKPITEISETELLDLIKTNPAAVPGIANVVKLLYESGTDINEFLSFYQISEGENRVTGTLLYNLYKRWSLNPRSRVQFTNEILEFFPIIRYGVGYVFFINKTKNELLIEKGEFKTKKLKTQSKSWSQHFQNYLKKYNIKTGRFYVKDVVLYNLYDKWLYEQRRKHNLSLQQFNHFCKVFFKSKRIKGHIWFAVDKKIQEILTPNLLEQMKK